MTTEQKTPRAIDTQENQLRVKFYFEPIIVTAEELAKERARSHVGCPFCAILKR